VAVRWAGTGQEDDNYAVDIQITAGDRKGLLRDITAVFSNEDVDVTGVKTHTDRRRQSAGMRFSVQISSIAQLERLQEKLLQVPDVMEVRRAV
jgi:GTP pyrophosphokinase